MKETIMKIEMNRKEILELMQELSEEHWMNERLTNALAEINSRANNDFMENTAVLVKPKNSKTKFVDHEYVKESITAFERVVEYAEKSGRIDTGHCAWETYASYCNKTVKEGSRFQLCDEHIREKCSKCGSKAFLSCPIELQFVCGEPLCSFCDHYDE